MDLFGRNGRVREMKNHAVVLDYFEHPRWQLVTLFERLSGFWPDQSKRKQYPLQLYHFLVLLSIFSAVTNQLTKYVGVDNDMALECCLFMFFMFALIIKLVFASKFQRQRQEIYERVVKHFKLITDENEVRLLNDCANQGFKYIVIYLCTVGTLVGIFDSVPVLRSFYNYYFHHVQLDMEIPLPMDYGFDHKKYWYIIAMDYLMFVYSGILIDFAYDLAFILQIRHVQALFEIVGMRLQKASELVDDDSDIDVVHKNGAEKSYSMISSAIDLHSECLEIVEMVEQIYTYSWFLILLISTAAFGASFHVVSTKFHDPPELFRYVCAFIVVVLHFQVIFAQGQGIADSSYAISDACYNSEWYRLPRKSCQLLSAMMVQSSIPCTLTGGKMFPLSTESFGKMLKAGLSYYTVFEA